MARLVTTMATNELFDTLMETPGPLSLAREVLSPLMTRVLEQVRSFLDVLFATFHMQPTTDLDVALAVVLLTSFTTLLSYYLACGRQHRNTRKQLRQRLTQMRLEVSWPVEHGAFASQHR